VDSLLKRPKRKREIPQSPKKTHFGMTENEKSRNNRQRKTLSNE
jgi:hypothetical protein